MGWNEQWRALAARIEGLMGASKYLLSTFAIVNVDQYAIGRNWILPHFSSIKADLVQFRDRFAAELPTTAVTALNRFIQEVVIPDGVGGNHVSNVQTLAQLADFRAQFEYLIRDVEIEARAVTELAFEHLRRLIVVDADTRKAWCTAFDTHETHCEKLGAVHLLSHGIWAFKAQGDGAATDLVYNEPLNNFARETAASARALVLTEWKRVTDPAALGAKAAEARAQAQLYAGGLLRGLELRSTRYVVLVAKSNLARVEDVVDRGVTYRHIVVPVDPATPSVAAQTIA